MNKKFNVYPTIPKTMSFKGNNPILYKLIIIVIVAALTALSSAVIGAALYGIVQVSLSAMDLIPNEKRPGTFQIEMSNTVVSYSLIIGAFCIVSQIVVMIYNCFSRIALY